MIQRVKFSPAIHPLVFPLKTLSPAPSTHASSPAVSDLHYEHSPIAQAVDSSNLTNLVPNPANQSGRSSKPNTPHSVTLIFSIPLKVPSNPTPHSPPLSHSVSPRRTSKLFLLAYQAQQSPAAQTQSISPTGSCALEPNRIHFAWKWPLGPIGWPILTLHGRPTEQ